MLQRIGVESEQSGINSNCRNVVQAIAADSHWCKHSVKQGCFQLGLQSSADASRGSGLLSVQWFRPKLQKLVGASAVSLKSASSLGCTAVLLQAACTKFQACCMCRNVGQSCKVSHMAASSMAAEQPYCKQHAQGFRSVVCATMWAKAAESHRCMCSLTHGCFQLGMQISNIASSMHRGIGLVSVQQCRP